MTDAFIGNVIGITLAIGTLWINYQMIRND